MGSRVKAVTDSWIDSVTADDGAIRRWTNKEIERIRKGNTYNMISYQIVRDNK